MTDPGTVLVKVARRRSLTAHVLLSHASDGRPVFGHRTFTAGELVSVATDEVALLRLNGFITDVNDDVLPEIVQDGTLPKATVNGRDASYTGPQ